MDTEKYCSNLESLDKIEAIRAIHGAYLQLKAMGDDCHLIENKYNTRVYDNKPVLELLRKCLAKAGHIGFN